MLLAGIAGIAGCVFSCLWFEIEPRCWMILAAWAVVAICGAIKEVR